MDQNPGNPAGNQPMNQGGAQQGQGGQQQPQQPNYQIEIADEVKPGIYTNAVSVSVNSNECILDMGYALPNQKDPVIQVVSRINMTHKTAESFLKVLSNALLDWRNKQKEREQQNQGGNQQPQGGAPVPPPQV